MTLTHSLTLPAACRPLSPAEADAVLGGADTATDEGSFTTVLSNIEKVSKVFNYMARICRIVLGGDFSDFVTRWHPMGR